MRTGFGLWVTVSNNLTLSPRPVFLARFYCVNHGEAAPLLSEESCGVAETGSAHTSNLSQLPVQSLTGTELLGVSEPWNSKAQTLSFFLTCSAYASGPLSMRLRCDRCLLFKHSLCLQADFDEAWEKEHASDLQEEAAQGANLDENGSDAKDGDFEDDEDDEEPEESLADSPPRGNQSLGAFFEEDDEEEGAQAAAGGLLAPETQELLELYELAGYQVPRLTGPDCFTPNDITFGQGLVIPTQESGGWLPAIQVLEDLLEQKSEGLFQRFSAKAIQKWKVNKPLKLKTGIELPKGAVPLCEALATLRDVATDAHQGCKKTRFIAQQNNGLPYICCSVHHSTPEYNFVRIPGWLVAATSTLCLQGYYYPEHKDKWVEVLCDDRRLVLLEYVILWNVYIMNDVATKVNRPELRICPSRLVGGAAAAIQAKADDKRKLKALTGPEPKSAKKNTATQSKIKFQKGTPKGTLKETPKGKRDASAASLGKTSNKKAKQNITPIKMKSVADLSEEQREAAFADYMAKQGM